MHVPSPESENSESPVNLFREPLLVGFLFSWAILVAVFVPAEVTRFNDLEGDFPGLLFDWNVDTTPFVLLLLALPACWIYRRPLINTESRGMKRLIGWLSEGPREFNGRGPVLRAWLFAGIVGAVAFLSCVRVSTTIVFRDQGFAFGDLPPAIHDELSYVFQAETFAAGRWSFYSHLVVPRVFDQMHVLNEGYFASRYFPGTGLWMAPFVAIGDPVLGHWVATTFVCMLVFGIGRELSCNGAGLLAGLLAALSPSLVLFGNLLLAHQPTLVGLCVFILAFLKATRVLAEPESSESVRLDARPSWLRLHKTDWLCVSGYGLAFAMLCRPMTAAGIGLPFGLWLVSWLIRNTAKKRKLAVAVLTGYGVPLCLGFLTILVQNTFSTGDPLKTSYQLYTELFTPSHMYGFNNVERAQPFLEKNAGRILENYDSWAENLDPKLAVQNVGMRFLASWQWTLGLSSLVVAGGVVLSSAVSRSDSRLPARWWLIPAAILSIHLAHIPYWYDGILHWHYVFESGVLWCLVTAAATLLLSRFFRRINRPAMSTWWGVVLIVSVLINNVSIPPFWHQNRLDAGIREFAFSRGKQKGISLLIEGAVTDQRALVLIRHDPADRHNDFVSNHPSLAGPVLRGRLPLTELAGEPQLSPEEVKTLREVEIAFPDRAILILDAVNGRVISWSAVADRY